MKLLGFAFVVLLAILMIGANVAAAPRLTCSVTPTSGPAGSQFTLTVSGAVRGDTYGDWLVKSTTDGSLLYDEPFDVGVPPAGKFTLTQTIPVAGTAVAVVHSYHWSYYTSCYPAFTVTP